MFAFNRYARYAFNRDYMHYFPGGTIGICATQFSTAISGVEAVISDSKCKLHLLGFMDG